MLIDVVSTMGNSSEHPGPTISIDSAADCRAKSCIASASASAYALTITARFPVTLTFLPKSIWFVSCAESMRRSSLAKLKYVNPLLYVFASIESNSTSLFQLWSQKLFAQSRNLPTWILLTLSSFVSIALYTLYLPSCWKIWRIRRNCNRQQDIWSPHGRSVDAKIARIYPNLSTIGKM